MSGQDHTQCSAQEAENGSGCVAAPRAPSPVPELCPMPQASHTPHSLFPEPRVPFGSGFGQRSLVAPYFFLCVLPAALTPLPAPELPCSKLQLSLCLIHLSRKLRLCPLNCYLLSNSWLSVLLLGLLALPLCHLHWVKYKNDSSSLNTLIASLRQW